MALKTVLVTGGTCRLGKAIAERLNAQGYRVLTSSHRADAGADFVADLAAPGAAERLYDEAVCAVGRPLDALVNNAALFDGAPERLKTVNFDAPCALLDKMAARASGRGSVVNILDANALAPDAALTTPYLKLKARLARETRRAARLQSKTLRVNAVAPGDVLPVVGLHVKSSPRVLDRRPTAEDVAEAVAFLLSAPSLTGVILPVDGGRHLLVGGEEVLP